MSDKRHTRHSSWWAMGCQPATCRGTGASAGRAGHFTVQQQQQGGTVIDRLRAPHGCRPTGGPLPPCGVEAAFPATRKPCGPCTWPCTRVICHPPRLPAPPLRHILNNRRIGPSTQGELSALTAPPTPGAAPGGIVIRGLPRAPVPSETDVLALLKGCRPAGPVAVVTEHNGRVRKFVEAYLQVQDEASRAAALALHKQPLGGGTYWVEVQECSDNDVAFARALHERRAAGVRVPRSRVRGKAKSQGRGAGVEGAEGALSADGAAAAGVEASGSGSASPPLQQQQQVVVPGPTTGVRTLHTYSCAAGAAAAARAGTCGSSPSGGMLGALRQHGLNQVTGRTFSSSGSGPGMAGVLHRRALSGGAPDSGAQPAQAPAILASGPLAVSPVRPWPGAPGGASGGDGTACYAARPSATLDAGWGGMLQQAAGGVLRHMGSRGLPVFLAALRRLS